jgi:poly-gamma-glutamate synthesis protein (capsule biosynthesis protein)
MRGHAEYVQGLVEAGFQVLNVANNHSMQHGPEPFEDTVAMLQGVGIEVCGLRAGDASKPVVLTVQNVRVAFLGYSLRPRQYFSNEPLYAEGRRDGILADVSAARAGCDVVAVSLHWGDEFIDRPSPADVGLAHDIVDAGASLVIGHHPHVLRGVERYGRGWIVYSLGNFVCDMLWSEELRQTAIAECHVTRGGVEAVRLLPVRINNQCQPVPLHGREAERLARRIADLSAALEDRRGLANAPAATADYDRDAYDAQRRQRARSHRYFLRNAYRYPPRILTAQLLTYARNRLAERGWISPDHVATEKVS